MNPVQTDRDRGNALYLQGRYAEAAECYRRALRQRPDDVDALNNLGAALADQGRLADAVECYQRALRLQPRHAEAVYNLGNALRLAGKFDEAIDCYVQALQLRPEMAQGHNNLGIALRKRGRLAESMASARRALELRPGDPPALVNLGLGLAESGRLVEALACYDEVIRKAPHDADAHHDRAQAWLLLGDWARGWPEYEWRWKCAEFTPHGLRQPPWDGTPLDGRTILLHAEQGAGDTLQFVRYARLVTESGGRVVLAAPERLHPILRTAPGIDSLVPLLREAPPPEFDVHCPLLSLPALFGTTPQSLPARTPYLSAEPGRIARWRQALEPIEGCRVGIAWQGSPTMLPYDRWRSVPLEQFEPLARVEGVRLISLQQGPGSEQLGTLAGHFPIVDLAGELDDNTGAFLDTAAIMANLDLVITCDTAIAHLGGALGVPTWVALASVPNWRWLLDREDTPWYPTVRLFRQIRAGSWEEPLRRMADALRNLAGVDRPVAVEITPGELIDRLVILQIKADRITDPEKLRNVHAELVSLEPASRRLRKRGADLESLTTELRRVNEVLWETEDAVRRCEAESDFGPHFIDLARSVYRNNDARAALKRRINERLGCARQEEKQYATG
jgi:Flp pilus assembly protein TadD